MRTRLMIAMTLTACGIAFVEVSAGNEPAAADPAQDKAKPEAVAEAKETKKFEPPPGFKTKRFGDKVFYCEKSASMGTRLKSEKCYDELQLKLYLLDRDQANRNAEQTRRLSNDPSR